MSTAQETETVEALRAQIEEHARRYRAGEPTISDAEYNALVARCNTLVAAAKPNGVNGTNGHSAAEVAPPPLPIDVMVDGITDLRGEALSTSIGKICAALVHHDAVLQETTLKAIKEKTGLTLKALKLALLDQKKQHFKNVCDLETGSDAEVADLILHQFGGPLIYTEGDFYTLDDGTKLWGVVERAKIELQLHALDGSMMASGGMWLADDRAVKGAINRMVAIASQPRFFADAPRGLALKNTFMYLDGDKLAGASLGAQHRARFALPWAYDAKAEAPQFKKFLNEIFAGDEDAQQKIELIMEFIGACLLGIATRYQMCVVLTGEGDNGKSTLIDILRALFEASKITAIPPNKLTQEYYVAALAGKVINLCAETPKSEMRDSDKFKSVVTGDDTTGRSPYERVMHFKPIAGHMFGCNTLPGTDDQTKGFWRRFVVVTFNRIFQEHEKDKTLAQKIVAAEMPAILRMALDAAKKLIAATRYTIPKSSEDAKNAWMNDTDSVARFATECLEKTKTTGNKDMDKTLMTSSTEVYKNFSWWTKVHGEPLMSHTKFGKRLRALGYLKHEGELCNSWFVTIRKWEGQSRFTSLFG